jgi:hypothetical protein
MPATPGSKYYVSSYIKSWVGTSNAQAGSDIGATTTYVIIDNESPDEPFTAGVDWKSASAATVDSWKSIAYGNGTFVALPNSGTTNAMSSSDGRSWTLRTSAGGYQWNAITYGNNQFVAVAGDTNAVMTSATGTSWTLYTGMPTSGFTGVAYGGGKYVAIGGSPMYSSDGINWATSSVPLTQLPSWSAITYGNGKFVAVGDGNEFITSPDGINWTAVTAGTGQSYYITYGNGVFVAVSYNGSYSYYSQDGVTWTLSSLPILSWWSSVAYGGGIFVTVSNDGTGRVATSPDGITWTLRSAAESNSWQSVTYASSTFVAVSSNGTNRVMYSTGISATATSSQATITWTTSTDTDITSSIVLQSTSTAVTGIPTEGSSYATSTTISGNTVICSYTVTASTTYSCNKTGLTNGTPYYYKIFSKDTSGTWYDVPIWDSRSYTPVTRSIFRHWNRHPVSVTFPRRHCNHIRYIYLQDRYRNGCDSVSDRNHGIKYCHFHFTYRDH